MNLTHFTGPTVCPDFDNPLGTEVQRLTDCSYKDIAEKSPCLDFGKPSKSVLSSVKRPDYLQSFLANLATGQSRPTLLELIRNTSFQ